MAINKRPLELFIPNIYANNESCRILGLIKVNSSNVWYTLLSIEEKSVWKIELIVWIMAFVSEEVSSKIIPP